MSSNHLESVYINEIDFTQLNYLTGVDICSSSLTSTNFNLTTGKPLNNLNQQSENDIDPFFLNTISSNFSERTNVHDDLIYEYPQLLELDTLRDMKITDETVIETVFIQEGASMQNMFGYYMYELDINDEPLLLSTDTNNNSLGYYYTPTVIFPHIFSDPEDTNTIQTGNKRKLKGNMPNGTFKNIYIGFFLVPHGWYAFKNSGPIYNDGILYSTINLNQNKVNSEYKLVSDKIYSVYFKAISEEGNELLLVGFEDIFFNQDKDLDYNDCMIGFVASDVNNIENYDKYCNIEVVEEIPGNNLIFMDENGEYVGFDKNLYNLPNDRDIVFERHLCFDNEEDRDELYTSYGFLHSNYNLGNLKDDSFGDYKFITKHRFRKHDIENCEEENNKKKFYLFESKYDRENVNKLERYQKNISKMLYKGLYTEKYSLYEEDTENSIVGLEDIIDSPVRTCKKKFRITGNGSIDCSNGKNYLPSNKKQIYRIFDRISSESNFAVKVKMDDHPDSYKLGKKYFTRYVSFKCNGERLVIDLGNMNMYTISGINLVLNNNPVLTHITFSSITYNDNGIKQLINVFKNNSNAYYRTITLNDILIFYCIRLPDGRNNPTAIFLDNRHMLEWNDRECRLSGTYYNKDHIYESSKYDSSDSD